MTEVKFKWIEMGNSFEDEVEFFIVASDFDVKQLLLSPDGEHDLIAQVKDREWAERIVKSLNGEI